MINNYTLYKLIEVAEQYDDKEFVQQCWNTYHCLNEVCTANGRLYGISCGTGNVGHAVIYEQPK